jgi:hypothetical protein
LAMVTSEMLEWPQSGGKDPTNVVTR